VFLYSMEGLATQHRNLRAPTEPLKICHQLLSQPFWTQLSLPPQN